MEDEARVRQLMNAYLARHGFTVTSVPSGEAALKVFPSRAFDLVVLDLCDPLVVRRVLVNLIANGLRHGCSSQGGVVAAAPAGSSVRTRRGTGLGLTFRKLAVERHGGTIGVEGREGGGSRFWFRLPRADSENP